MLAQTERGCLHDASSRSQALSINVARKGGHPLKAREDLSLIGVKRSWHPPIQDVLNRRVQVRRANGPGQSVDAQNPVQLSSRPVVHFGAVIRDNGVGERSELTMKPCQGAGSRTLQQHIPQPLQEVRAPNLCRLEYVNPSQPDPSPATAAVALSFIRLPQAR